MTTLLLETLNPAQQLAVQAIDGPVLVLAGPGSGKTRVLTHRVAYLIDVVGIDPFNLLAVTFTNKAAREMKVRLEELIGVDRAAAPAIGTFHSLCVRFLRRDIVHLGRERDFAIYDADDQQRLMRRVLRDLKLDEKQYPPRAIHARISSAKNELVGPQEYARLNRASYYDEIVVRCYERYQALLRENNALDFDDLLFETVTLFRQHATVLEKYQQRYIYLMVDEYQDTNRAQYVLVRDLAARRRNLFAVGDNDQSIYAWRGADIRNILRFEEDYPDAQVVLLEQNYRSTQSILDVAQALIQSGMNRKHAKNLWTENAAGVEVSLHEGYDEHEEAGWVADEIARLRERDSFRLADCAIMYRTNAQSRVVEEALQRRGLPYQIVGGTRFYERKEIKDLLCYLRLIHNPYDSISLERILNVPVRGIGARTEEMLLRWANEMGVPVYQALQELAADSETHPFNARTRNALLAFYDVLSGMIVMRNQCTLLTLLEAILERLTFREALVHEYGPDEADERWRNVQQLANMASDFVNMPYEDQLPAFLENVALIADVDSIDQDADKVTCITLHQAKGLEYPVVFLIGLEEGLLPHSRSIDERDKLEEERRLLYVGSTRARQRLYLLYAFKRTSFGRTNNSTPSRFLASIPPDLIKQSARRQQAERPPHGESTTTRQPVRTQSTLSGTSGRTANQGRQRTNPEPTEIRFLPGQQVRHALFGAGEVVSSKLIDGDEEVTVNFATRGQKRLLASFAHLEKISPE